MKRILLAFFALLTLVVGFAQLQNVLPITVQRFLDERSDIERMEKANMSEWAGLYKSQFASPQMVNGVEMVDAFIDIDNNTAIKTLRNRGIVINCEFDGFVTAKIPVYMLSEVNHIPGVTNVEISRLVELCTDSTLSVTHAGQVLNGPDYGLPQAYDGTGVIIGIIDSGFDYQHLAFRTTNDTERSRIVRVFDVLNSTGHPVFIDENQLDGSVFMGEQIDTLTRDTDGSHGTHTTSIAAGMHVNGYGGMAPGADIVLCSVRNMDLAIPEANVVNAIKYIYSYADSVGKPCVISLSISTNDGAHDGTDRISKAVAQLSGPGRIFVISAGNAGSGNRYTCGPVTIDKPLNMLVGCSYDKLITDNTYYYRHVWFDTWVRDTGVRVLAKLHVYDKNTQRLVWRSNFITVYRKIDSSELSEYFTPDYSVDSVGYVSALISQNASNKYEVQCYVHNLKNNEYTISSSGYYSGRYQVGVTLYAPSLIYSRQPDSLYVDSWMCSGVRLNPQTVYEDEISPSGDTLSSHVVQNFYSWPSDNCCIGTYAVHDSIISAGAFVGRNSYYSYRDQQIVCPSTYYVPGGLYLVSAYQSPGRGPTGKHLPTVMAPGYCVVAAGSRYSYLAHPLCAQTVMWSGGSCWGVMSGTSMAAPTVAGIIAQWLQIEPNLSPGQVKNIIAETAIKDSYTMDPTYGVRFGPNGKIDAMAGVRYILSHHVDEILLGDVNGDGLINIKDVTTLINYMLNRDSFTDIVLENADVYQDDVITIRDLTTLITLLLNREHG